MEGSFQNVPVGEYKLKEIEKNFVQIYDKENERFYEHSHDNRIYSVKVLSADSTVIEIEGTTVPVAEFENTCVNRYFLYNNIPSGCSWSNIRRSAIHVSFSGWDSEDNIPVIGKDIFIECKHTSFYRKSDGEYDDAMDVYWQLDSTTCVEDHEDWYIGPDPGCTTPTNIQIVIKNSSRTEEVKYMANTSESMNDLTLNLDNGEKVHIRRGSYDIDKSWIDSDQILIQASILIEKID